MKTIVLLSLLTQLAFADVGSDVRDFEQKHVQKFDYNYDDLWQENGTIDGVIGIPPRPDACTLTTHENTIIEQFVDVPDYDVLPEINMYIEKSVLVNLPGPAEVVMLVNGNGYSRSAYDQIATFLAKNGFVVAVVRRPNGTSTDPDFILDALFAVFRNYEITRDSKVGLIGHSKAGGVVNEAAIENYLQSTGFSIKAIINVAPNVLNTDDLNGFHTGAFLSLWGSRDRDMTGSSGTPREGIAAYDKTGNEGTTTCGSPPCIALSPQLDKTSVYVNGADHAEMLDAFTTGIGIGAPTSYLSNADQACIGRAYLNAFLRKHLYNEQQFNAFLRNRTLPASLNQITTSAYDGMIGLAGSDLRLYHQFSPKQKRSIENFEDSNYSIIGKSAYVMEQLIDDDSFKNSPYFMRHDTNALVIGWEQKNYSQYLGIRIPNAFDDATSFTHLSVRVGLLNGIPSPYNNNHADETIRIGLRDQNYLGHYEERTIPRSDKHSTMQTITIPLSELTGINMQKLLAVYFIFERNTRGTIFIDNIEFIRDNQ